MDIQVVLTQDDPKLGKRGDILKVSSGYALNFLIPHKKAIQATPANLKHFEAEKSSRAKKEALLKSEAEALAQKIQALSPKLAVLVGESNKLYGAVTSQDIQQKLAEEGIAIDKKLIHLDESIKQLGVYDIPVKLHPTVTAKLKLSIIKKNA